MPAADSAADSAAVSASDRTLLHNPVVRGVAADPSVCRVGDDYYLATSTMDFWPGIPIRHSTDLVNWRIIGYAVTRPAQYRRDGRPGPLMLYAPTLRHHDGRFYLVCTNVADEQGNFLVTAEDPAGEWSDAVWVDRTAFDPSLTFADGTCYYTRRTLDPLPDGRLGPVVQSELDPATGELIGPLRELTENWSGFCSNDIEGPHLYRIGDWYYLFSAEGGTWRGHMQTCARSRSPWGPFEPAPHNPVLTHRHRVGHPIQSAGHAELVDAPDGSWWALFLGTRHDGFAFHHQLGRETFLAPVEWTPDGWPVIGNAGTVELEMELPRPLPGTGTAARTGPAPTPWTAGWATFGPPPDGLEARVAADTVAEAAEAAAEIVVPAAMQVVAPLVAPVVAPAPAAHTASELLEQAALPCLPAAPDGTGWPPAALFLRQRELRARFEATLHTLPDGAEAGVAVFTDPAHHYRLLIGTDDGHRRATLHRVVDDLAVSTTTALPGSGPVHLTVEADGTHYHFRATTDGTTTTVGSGLARLLAAEVPAAFTGCRFALLATGNAHTAERGDRAVLVDAGTAQPS